MFFFENSFSLKIDSIEIVSNYKVLHFDEFPILFIGNNKYGNKILGSHLEEDDENGMIYTLHTILTEKQYSEFLGGDISYLNILQNSSSISLVQRDFNYSIQKAYDIPFINIPKEYLPMENSFCPQLGKEYSLQFTLRLLGQLADANTAIAEVVSKIQNAFAELLEDRIKALKDFAFKPTILLQPYAEGSFKINFEVSIDRKVGNVGIFSNDLPLGKYLSKYIEYLNGDLSEDIEIFKGEEISDSAKLHELSKSLSEIYKAAIRKEPENLTHFLKEDIIKSTQKFEVITQQVGGTFDSLEIMNFSKTEEAPIAFIDRSFATTFSNDIEAIEIANSGITEDDSFKDYSIYIYHLNTDTRAGNAFIRNIEDENQMSKPKIKINGTEGLEQTKYAESLYLNKWIDVKAKAKRIGDKFKSLEIDFDS
ncbi:MAG: hypothetical protein JSS76_13710 [Bacteroidetes bacterium]|nr:hypothetical protein [Bacteroidota bacterium]